MEESTGSVPGTRGLSRCAETKSENSDEIVLVDCIDLLWRNKYLILAGAILPTLIVGFLTFSKPRIHSVTYTYANWNINNKDFQVFLEGFYSGKNVDRISNKLETGGLKDYAALLRNTRHETLKKQILFDVWSSKPEKKRASQPTVNSSDNSSLIQLTVTAANPAEDVSKIASIIRDSAGEIIPFFDIKRNLMNEIDMYEVEMSQIEKSRFSLKSSLKSKAYILSELKEIKVDSSHTGDTNATVLFDIGKQSEYLPIPYQIQAAESGIVQLKEQVRNNEELYAHYELLTELTEKLLSEIRRQQSSDYEIQQFHSFLSELIGSSKNEEAADYLSAHLKQLDNSILSGVPVTERPRVNSLGKGTVKKSGIAFALSLMISMFVAFIWDGIRFRQTRT